MYKLEVKLKQHTPLIHFQWEEEGATLRASEVKPKLDRFILTNLGKVCDWYEKGVGEYNKVKKYSEKDSFDSFKELENYEKGYWIAKAKKWLIGNGEHPALDYKMRIEAEVSQKLKEWQKRPMYFGKNKSVFYENIKLIIFSFYEEVIETLKKELSEFFFRTNFGSRQSKGYGCFEVVEMNGTKLDDENNFYIQSKSNENIIQFEIKHTNIEELFSMLELYYKSIRGGINLKDKLYCKPIIYHFAVEKKWEWEKRYIKRNYLIKDAPFYKKDKKGFPEKGIGYENQKIDDRDLQLKPSYLIRDLLGLAVHSQWEFYRISLEKSNEEIKRIPSPFQFKIYKIYGHSPDYTVFLIKNDDYLNKLWREIKGKKFELTIQPFKEDNIEWIGAKRQKVKTNLPFPNEESIYKELYEYIMNFEFENFEIEEKYKNTSVYSRLKNFFNSKQKKKS